MYFIRTDHPCVARVIYGNERQIITEDIDNPEYATYLEWLADGNEPEEWTDGD